MNDSAVEDQRWIVPPAASPVSPVRHVKGSLLYNSYRQIVACGHEARYVALAGEEFVMMLRTTSSAAWVPADVAHQHYSNVNSMQLAPAEIQSLAESAVSALNGIFLQTLSRASRVLGANAETALRMSVKVWPRLYDGGAVSVERTGPGAGTINFHQLPLMRVPYFRLANGVYIRAVLRLLGDDVRVREGAHDTGRLHYRYAVSWRP
jgi:hypothetical protein